jgi:hypothetical protein
MAKITAYVPEPTSNYDVNNQRQILEAINTIKDQLNFGYQQDLINQQSAMTQFIYGTQSGFGCDTGSSTNPAYVSFGGTNVDAFGRLRISQPYTLFDSQNRYATDNQFDTSTVTGGSTTYLPNEATVRMDVTTASGAEVVRQTFRSFPYQPGKGLLVLATFVMNEAKTNLRQRVGYFGTQNGVFFQLNNSTKSFILRTYISGSVDDTTRKVDQSAWNGDKLDGTGASGLTLDLTKPQILWMDFEWLGVGNVRCGFIINGQYIVCHTYQTANVTGTSVYMTTAILPLRYEITNTAETGTASFLKQICSTVISEGGYEQTSIEHIASMTSATAGSYITTTYKPLVSIRLASTALGAVVIPYNINFLPTTTDNYQIGLFKNGTLTSASYSAVTSDANVEFDITASAITGGTLVYSEFLTSRSGRSALSGASASFNFDLQLGASLAGASDVYSLCVRTLTGTGGGIGLLTFYDLTQ